MLIQFDQVRGKQFTNEAAPINRIYDKNKYNSSLRGEKGGYTIEYRITIPNIILGYFRIFTFLLHYLFVQLPNLAGFFTTEMSIEKGRNMELQSADWNLNPWGRLGPSNQQKKVLLHQFSSLVKQGEKWKNVQNGKNEEFIFDVTIEINKEKYFLNKKDLFESDDFGKGAFLKILSKPENYKRGEDIQIDLHFKKQCCIDHGFGPYRIKYSTIACTNTLGADGKALDTQEKNKTLGGHYRFFPLATPEIVK